MMDQNDSKVNRGNAPAGLYIHIPFCQVHCPFCDFAITTDRRGMEDWLSALGKEMALRRSSWIQPFDTVYLGGGTPSLLKPGTVGEILERVRSCFEVETDCEVTLEANPGDLGPDGFKALRDLGVNRLSLGIQSFEEEELRFLGRDHTVKESLESFGHARAGGFENITVDLLMGLPRRSRENWGAQLEQAIQLGPEHLSAYQLTYEPGTPITRRRDRGELRALSDGEEEEHFLFTRERLEGAGYVPYEVSSFARSPRFESRHNRKYWEDVPYLGLGPSAHSFRDGVRSWNARSSREYVLLISGGQDPEAGREVLSSEERRLERIFLGLRTARGLRLDLYERDFGNDLRKTQGPRIEELRQKGLAILEEDVLRLSPRGLAVSDDIAGQLAGQEKEHQQQ